ncbi:MAG TPA: carboxylating nicotinate-nucleotide diphosphorylase [Vampirovibrionales bacterium]
MFSYFDQVVEIALREDLEPHGDITSSAIHYKDKTCTFKVRSREQGGIMSGLQLVKKVYEILDPSVKVLAKVNDGDNFEANSELAIITGSSESILKGERVFLNLLQRAISIATYTKLFVKKISHTKAKVLDTRKTSPGLRLLEKNATRDGGAYNHRFNLSTGILIKDNHIAACGGIEKAVKAAKENAPYLSKIEVEVDSLEQLRVILPLGVDVVLFDNFKIEELKTAVKMTQDMAITEASGGVNLDSISSIAETGVQYISIGALTQSTPQVDIGLDF